MSGVRNMHLPRACLLAALIGYGYSAFVCESGWTKFGNSCYLFGNNKSVPFLQAKEYCHNLDAVLVEIETETENNFIKAYLIKHRGEEYWLGLTDNVTEKEWTWYDSLTEVKYSDWRPNEPNNAHQENCAVMALQQYTWNDVHCGDKHEPICEISFPEMGIVG